MVLRNFLRVTVLTMVVMTSVFQIAQRSAFGQTQAINGSMRGRLTDPAGAAVPAGSVSVTNDATGFTREVTSNGEGYFVIPNLPIGTYTMSIKKEGFEAQRRPGIVLDAGTEAVIDGQLKVGAVSTTIDVTG